LFILQNFFYEFCKFRLNRTKRQIYFLDYIFSNKQKFNNTIMQNNSLTQVIKRLSILLVLFFTTLTFSQTTKTFPAGSLIVDMGIEPQTVGNGLKPYGMIYDLVSTFAVPINWIIDPLKPKDGTDFTISGYAYKGGPFVISAEYLIPVVTARIATWTAQGVRTVITTAPATLPVFREIVVSAIPRWTLDKDKGSIAQVFFTNAGIPASAYGGATSATWKTPAQLDGCDDIFVMPHADPVWATHANLMTWNQVHKGSIWLGCHAGSALENMFNPANPSQQTNFLSVKTGTSVGAGPYSQNALLLWGNHSNGTPPYTYEAVGDPVMQFMGPLDAATLNGSEQIYIPLLPGWRPTTVVSCFDPDHPQLAPGSGGAVKNRAAVIAYGPGYGVATNGMVMLEGGHSVAGTAPANIAAQRAFFNFSFLAARQKTPDPEIQLAPVTITSGATELLSFSVDPLYNINDFDITWSSSCSGVFSAPNAATTNFTAPQVNAPTNCTITVELKSKSICGNRFRNSTSVAIICALTATRTVTPACFGLTNGRINVSNIIGGVANYNWTLTGTSSATGTSATPNFTINNLAPGPYTVNIRALNGSGCGTTFSTTVGENTALTAAITPTNPRCNGASNGAIDLAVGGGSPGYTFAWTASAGGVIPPGQASNRNLNGLVAGTYSVVVTDNIGCTTTTSQILSQPGAFGVTPAITTVGCFGASTGAVALTVAGGTGPFTYLWNDGNTSQNRTGLAAGTYSVTVTDANTCTATASSIAVTQPAAALTLSHTQTNILSNGASTGAIDLTVSGGTSPYTYAWVGPAGFTASSQDISSRPAGAYNVTVTDARGCVASRSVTLTEPVGILVSAAVTNALCPPGAQTNGNTGAINLTVSGGAPGYTYDWTGIGTPGDFTDPEDRTSIPAGSYTVAVRDTNGATVTTTVTVTNINPNPATPASINH
jgi:hypothetical protein